MFKLPIEYNGDKLVQNIVDDLELDNCYKCIINNSLLRDKWTSYFSSDKLFLLDTQNIIKNFKSNKYEFKEIYEQYKTIRNESSFIDKYQYIPFEIAEKLNKSTTFMQLFSYYNLSAPIFSIITPIIILIMPYFIIKLSNSDFDDDLSMKLYLEVLKEKAGELNFFNIFDTTTSIETKFKTFISFLFYLFQIYQNIMSCIKFYLNINNISEYISNFKKLLIKSINLADDILNIVDKYESYELFKDDIKIRRTSLTKYLSSMDNIIETNSILVNLVQIGNMMTTFYKIYSDNNISDVIDYMYLLNEYNDDMHDISTLISNKKLNICSFNNVTKINKGFYILHMDNDNNIKNNIDLSNNILITGPNASGKTTILKSIFINNILSQQIGFGCYESAEINIYNYFHSYINIPDTSDRDSLFQAEARRCKDILEFVTLHSNKKHFCIFDEIYSGTNPQDATSCAKLYVKGLDKFSNVSFIVTTHYIDLCKSFENGNNDNVNNYKMDVEIDKNNDICKYLYTISKGISEIHGGIKILRDMEYPEYLFDL